MGTAKSKDVSKAMQYEKTPVSKSLSKTAVYKDIERNIDTLGFHRLLWYIIRRYKFQISFVLNVYFIGKPLFDLFSN